jgi:hypothetical protein
VWQHGLGKFNYVVHEYFALIEIWGKCIFPLKLKEFVGLNLPSCLSVSLSSFLPTFVCLFVCLLVWTLLRTHFRCTGLFLHLIVHNDTHAHARTHTHTYTHARTHFVWFLWTRDWPITETLTRQHNIHKTQISVHPAGFEPTIPTSEWPQAHTLECSDTRISLILSWEAQLCILWCHIVFSFNFILFSCFTVLVWDQPDETPETTAGVYKL